MLALYYSLIVLFGVTHSVLVANQVKEYMHRIISKSTYRLVFNFVSIIFLASIIWVYAQLDHSVLFEFPLQLIVGWVVALSGAALSYIAFKSYNTAEFFGLKEELENQNLAVKGMNRHVRHPLYLASFIMLWGALLIEPTQAYLGFAVILSIYLVIGTKLEEAKLIETFGQAYVDYQKRVPMFFPWR